MLSMKLDMASMHRNYTNTNIGPPLTQQTHS